MDVAGSYEDLGQAVHGSGPLGDETRALVKLAISGAHAESATAAKGSAFL